jgi:hypothetical protein
LNAQPDSMVTTKSVIHVMPIVLLATVDKPTNVTVVHLIDTIIMDNV